MVMSSVTLSEHFMIYLIACTLVTLLSNTAAMNESPSLNSEDAYEFDMVSVEDSGQLVLGRKPMNDEQHEPMQLLRPGKGHDRLELNVTVLERLATIEEPIAIVGIVGPYHGGKSFLLNVLLNSTHGFPVGVKPEPETKGIWIRIVSNQSLTGVDGSQLILLDTEGFYGERATRLYDARIFAIATLLSSHLVYNTLRTLGDTQSVSALADLAKQAQVFNLQNWLHTGNMTTDEPSVSTTMDPSLLLKTLDFPPLTWVVQGFDIDLQTSHTPMDYLQRYLAAYAHTGDRTLDTLFTRGISCYALRTPADVNLLREQYGSKILAADEELYTTLHPGYLADMDKLRNGIFGNLTSKGHGKLTGKAIAALLPLLVYYVNEDFPLHADRKLRDVLVDIIVDGAFAGGVEYFQKCMHDVSIIDAVVLARRGKQSIFDGKDMAAISGLATSALTAEELETVMTSAEYQAIEYCRHRSVGVPQHVVATSCGVQLGVKINNMKPSFREENERRVKEVLVRLGEGLHSTAGKNVLELKLPIAENDLQQKCNQIIKDSLDRYETLVGPHKGSHLYHEARAQMQEEIQAKCEKVARINGEKMSSIFNAAKALFQSEYEHSFVVKVHASDVQAGNDVPSTVEDSLKEMNGRPLPPKKLNEIHSLSLNAAELSFKKGVKDGLSWMGPGNELYDFHHFLCLQWIKQRYTEIQAHNNMLIREFCEKTLSALTLQYRAEVSSITPFPDNDETISEKAEEIGKHLMQKYIALTKDYDSSAAVEEKRKELAHSIGDTTAHLLKKNTALMAAFCYDPLMDAYKDLHMQDCERSFHNMWVSWSFWSRKCLWPGPQYMFGFKYSAYKAARKRLDKAQASVNKGTKETSNHEIAKGVVLSPATRNKVIQAWIEHDLAPYGNIVLVNFSIVSACIVVFVSTLMWMLRKVADSTSRHHKLQSDDAKRWQHYADPISFKTEDRFKHRQ